MAVYTTTRCGNCKKIWEAFETGRNGIIGAPFIKCRHCQVINNTGKKLYRDSTKFERFLFWFRNILVSILQIFGALLFGAILVFNFDNLIEDYGLVGKILLCLTLIGVVVTPIYYIRRLIKFKNELTELEERHDNNGGFMWSDQF